MSERELFEAALERQPEERGPFLDGACGGDAALRGRVETLLVRHAEAAGFLERPALSEGLTGAYRPVTEHAGTVVGPYKLLQQIGEGGFGVVYMAEQERPVRRMVALKIIKPGMDTAQVIARFEAERQALALMDHPNIAKVLDAGATESGRPYFVMELVKGVPITEFCDKNRIPAEQRLRLFLDVCHAIQHAHQKGVIHRDVGLERLAAGRPGSADIRAELKRSYDELQSALRKAGRLRRCTGSGSLPSGTGRRP
jgi:eukaryotic-like serine/threonine-protein kinase